MMGLRPALAWLLVVAVAGCEGGPGAATGTMTLPDPSVGVHEVAVFGPEGEWDPDPGSEVDAVPWVIGLVRDATWSRTGERLILDQQARRIHRFDSAGEYRGGFAGPGEGPGELDAPIRLEAEGDSVFVWDLRLSRIAMWRPDGTVLGVQSVDFRPWVSEEPRARRLGPGEWLYADPQPPDVDPAILSDGDSIRGSTPILHWASERGWRELLTLPSPPSRVRVLSHGGLSVARTPFAAEPQWDVAGGEAFWYLDASSDSIRLETVYGDTLATLPVGIEGREVTSADASWYREGPSSRPLPEALRAERAEVPLPLRHPAVTGLLSDGPERVWLRISTLADEAEVWWVRHLDPALDFRVDLPAGAALLRVRDHRLLVRDRDGVGAPLVRELVIEEG